MRSIVLAPIEPVAPKMVIERTAGMAARADLDSGTALVIASSGFLSPHQKSARRRRHAAARDDGRRHESVEPVHDAAVSGNDMACVLDAEPPLDRRLEQVAGLRHRRE